MILAWASPFKAFLRDFSPRSPQIPPTLQNAFNFVRVDYGP